MNVSKTSFYKGPVRDGIFGRISSNPGTIMECGDCGVQRLTGIGMSQADYASERYRQAYNDTSEPGALLKLHDPDQAERIKLVGLERLRDMTVLDYGCGHGAFLDAAVGVARKTYGVEPMLNLHKTLRSRGHGVFASGKEALRRLASRVDVVTCFGVIEHVQDPAGLMKDCFRLLSKGGLLFLQTDSLNDILLQTQAKEFRRFFYRTAHAWYFLPENIKSLLVSAGFRNTRVSTTHGYDFSKFVRWHREGKPTGNAARPLLGATFDKVWKATLEEAGCADLISAIASKGQAA